MNTQTIELDKKTSLNKAYNEIFKQVSLNGGISEVIPYGKTTGKYYVVDSNVSRQVLRNPNVAITNVILSLFKYSGFGIQSTFTLSGKEHREARSKIQPYFTPDGVAKRSHTISEIIAEELNNIVDGQIDIIRFMKIITAKVISVSVLGLEVDNDDLAKSANLVEKMENNLGNVLNSTNLPTSLIYLLKTQRNIKALREFLDTKIKSNELNENGLLFKLKQSSGYDEERLLDEALIMFFAGHETTSLLLSWMLYYLLQTQNKDTYDSLVTDLRSNQNIDMENAQHTIQKLIHETLRIVPPIADIWRQALKDIIIIDSNGNEVLIPKGSLIVTQVDQINKNILPDASAGHNPHNFDNPEDLESFMELHKSFGDGPKICVGRDFALEEMKLILTQLLQHFNLHPVDPNQIVQAIYGIVNKMDVGEYLVQFERVQEIIESSAELEA